MGKLDWAWLPLPTGDETAGECPAKSLFSLYCQQLELLKLKHGLLWLLILNPSLPFSDSLLITAKKCPSSYNASFDPKSQHDTLIPSPCLKGSYSLLLLKN